MDNYSWIWNIATAVLLLATLAATLFQVWASLDFKKELEDCANISKKNLASLQNITNFIAKPQQTQGYAVGLQQNHVSGPLSMLKEVTANLEKVTHFKELEENLNDLRKASNNLQTKLNEGQQELEDLRPLKNKVSDLETNNSVLAINFEEIKKEKEGLDVKLEEANKTLVGEKDQKEKLESDRKLLKNMVTGYQACLPVDEVNRIYSAVEKKCTFSDDDQSGVHYVFSRLAVLVAIGNPKVEADGKGVMLRDAFSDFDKAMYAQFNDKKDLLKALRDCFEDELKVLLDGTITFRWPVSGAPLDLREHRQERENGSGIIKEVKSAVLCSASDGSIIQKADVVT